MNLGLQTVTDFNGISGLCIPDDVMMRMHLRHLSDRRGISDQSMRFDADAIIRCTDKAVLNLHKAAARHVDSITGHNTWHYIDVINQNVIAGRRNDMPGRSVNRRETFQSDIVAPLQIDEEPVCVAVRKMPAGTVDHSVSYNRNVVAVIRVHTARNNSPLFHINRVIRL